DQVAEELERLSRSNQELEAKARNFHEQLRAFRERDKALNDALISAQQLRGEIREQAQREAQLIIREAQGEAERSLESLRGEIRRAEDELQQLWRNRRSYIQQLRNLMERQVHELDTSDSVPPPPGINVSAAESARDSRRDTPREPSRDGVREFTTPANTRETVREPVREIQRETKNERAADPGAIVNKPAPLPPSRPSIPTPSWLDVMESE
ncbi:MAG: DivIVA domain-containing protein, partial [Gemmatimonadaceae bacterium]